MRAILPQAKGIVTLAGSGPSEATDFGSLVLSGTPWMKTTRLSSSSFCPGNAFPNAASRALADTVFL
jgi:hypothetical protein